MCRLSPAEQELEADIIAELDRKGLLASIRAELRLAICEALDGDRAAYKSSLLHHDSLKRLQVFQQQGAQMSRQARTQNACHCAEAP